MARRRRIGACLVQTLEARLPARLDTPRSPLLDYATDGATGNALHSSLVRRILLRMMGWLNYIYPIKS